MVRRIALETSAVAQQGQANRPASRNQMACCHETVAAVIAGSAADQDGPRVPPGLNRFGNSPTGVLHKRAAGHAAGNGRGIGTRHLRYAEQRSHGL